MIDYPKRQLSRTLFRIALPASLLFGFGVVAAVIVDGIGLLISRQPAAAQRAA